MKFSEGRLSHIAHRILATLKEEGLAEVEREGHVLGEIKRVLEREHERQDHLDDIVRRKIASLSRQVPPGSREWDVLYKRYLDEEQRKQKS